MIIDLLTRKFPQNKKIYVEWIEKPFTIYFPININHLIPVLRHNFKAEQARELRMRSNDRTL